MFLIYINDLQNITSLKVVNFADDTLLYTTLKKTHIQDSNKLNLELKNVLDWLIVNKLKLNINKTRYPLSSSKNKVLEKHHF